MIVSFNLDGVLFIDPAVTEAEAPLKFPNARFNKDRLRLGTVELLSNIQKGGIGIWIYTTSNRPARYVKSLFKKYGISIDSVVNLQRHQKEVQANHAQTLPLVYPPRYRIAVHVDNDPDIAKSGKAHGFKVYEVDESKDWQIDLWEYIKRLKSVGKD